MLRVYLLFITQLVSALLVLSACSTNEGTGPVQVRTILPAGGRCRYEIAPTELKTLYDIHTMRGAVGRVVYSPQNLDDHPEILYSGNGFKAVDVTFSESDGIYTPVDLTSLYAVSLYAAIERGFLLFQGLDSSTDLSRVVPNFNETFIVYEARANEGGAREQRIEMYDNASYMPLIPDGSFTVVLNYFFSFPTKEISQVPMGLNVGIMVHEFSHMVMQHVLRTPGNKRGLQADNTTHPTMNTLDALDEGMADYFGFLATNDPAFFQCTEPSANRDLSVGKGFTNDIISNLSEPRGDSSFDPHSAGAVWAAIQFEIGNAIGHETNAKSLARLMSGILTCVDATAGSLLISADFGTIGKCHRTILQQMGVDMSPVNAVYQRTMGLYGGF